MLHQGRQRRSYENGSKVISTGHRVLRVLHVGSSGTNVLAHCLTRSQVVANTRNLPQVGARIDPGETPGTQGSQNDPIDVTPTTSQGDRKSQPTPGVSTTTVFPKTNNETVAYLLGSAVTLGFLAARYVISMKKFQNLVGL